jgi:hypothetical protein
VILAGLALAGCQTTVIERLPQSAKTECPTPVLGAWIAVEDDGQDAADFGLLVHNDCTLESRGKDGAHPAHPPLPHLQFFTGAGKQLVLLTTPAAYELAEVKPDKSYDMTGFMIFAWQRHGDVLELQAPDHRHVANLIVNGAVHGRTLWDNKDQVATVYNFLSGDEAAIEQLLTHTDLFGDTKSMRLRRVGNDDKALNRALRAATSKAMKSRKDQR